MKVASASKRAVSTVVVAIIVVVVIVVGAGAYYASTMLGGSKSSNVSTTTQVQTTTTYTQPVTSATTSVTTTQEITTSTLNSQTSATETTTSAATTTLYSCTFTATTGTSTGFSYTIQNVLPFVENINGMTVRWNGTSGGTSFGFSDSYKVVSTNSSGMLTSYKVNVTYASSAINESSIAWVRSDGTVPRLTIAYGIYNFNETGLQAEQTFVGLMAPFTEESVLASQVSLYYSTYFHGSGPTSKMIGSVNMQVMTYVANSLPLDLNTCGISETVYDFTMQVGQVPQTSINLVTYMHLNATSSNGNADFTLEVTSLS